MAYQALYRKWRPQVFGDVLGQTATVKTLRRQIETGRIGHAYLFCGCRGTGKTTLAKIMSRAVNCSDPRNGEPCGECPSCRAILSDTSMDVIEMDAASNSRVEEMRDLLDQVMYPPQIGKYKVYIIDEVHMLSNSAFNALLKTLEEPPAHIVFILATTEPQKLPATILSRVQRYDFGRISPELMVGRMKEALADMALSAEEEALQIVARSADGAMRDAFSILDMCVSSADGGVITAAMTRELLGASDREFLFDFFEKLRERDESGVMRKIDALVRSGVEPQVFLKDLSAHSRLLLTVKCVKERACDILNITPEEEAHCREQAETFSTERLLSMLDLFTAAEGTLRNASSPRIGLESAALHACETNRGEDTSALVARIADLESELSSLKAEIASGAVRPAERRERPAASSPAESAEEKKPAPPKEFPSGDAEIWRAAVKYLLKNNAPLGAFVKMLVCTGSENGTLQLSAMPGKESALLYFSRQDKKTAVAEALKEVAGKEVPFVISSSKAAEPQISPAGQEKLFDTFGRENVQVVEGEKP